MTRRAANAFNYLGSHLSYNRSSKRLHLLRPLGTDSKRSSPRRAEGESITKRANL
jgi:hypothetical protein